MKHKTQHDRLAELGEALLREFDAAQTPSVPAEFDRTSREMLGGKKKRTVLQFVRWTARAAVLAFALVGAMTMAVLSVESLRMPAIQFAAACFAPEQEESIGEYRKLSYMAKDNVALGVYYDGDDSYQILWSNEYGQRLYNFRSPNIDEAFFRDLGAQFAAAEE